MSLSVPQELTKQEHQAILTHLYKLKGEEAMRSFEFELAGKPPLFIKQSHGILAEASTQHFLYILSNIDKSAPLVPRVIDAFSLEGYSFMVMENLKALALSKCDISEDEAVEHAASAVKWLLDQLPSVPEATFGRITSKAARVWHQIFKDHQAPRVFVNHKELAEYVVKASQRCRWEEQPFPANTEGLLTFFGDSCCIYHSDIKKDNFLLDYSGRVCIFNFQHIGVLPQVLQTYAFFNINESFAASVGRKLGYQPSSNADAMAHVSTVLQQSGGNASLKN